MNNLSKIYRRQFILMKDPYQKYNFKTLYLNNGYYLSYHPDLKVRTNANNILIGEAFSSIGSNLDITSPEQNMKYWAGRWVLVTLDSLYMDVCGMLGCFYSYKDGTIVVSSNLALLQEVVGGRWYSDHEIKRGEYHGVFDYYPIPYTPIEGIMSLLPSQYIDLKSCKIKARSDYNFNRFVELDTGEIIQQFIKGMENVLREIYNCYRDDIWITLTGGVDSRTIVALAFHAGIPFKTYTAERDDLKTWDRNIPPRIAKKIGVYHTFLQSRTKDVKEESRMDDILKQCGGRTTVGTEVIQYLVGCDVTKSSSAVVLWGPGWEVCTKYYHQYFDYCNSKDDVFSEYKRVCGNVLQESNIHKESIVSWLQNVREHPIEGFDWRERQFWEQREGAWLRYAYQVYDMFDSMRLSPINSQYLIELLSSANHKSDMTNEMVFDKIIEKQIIEQCCSQIAGITYGEPQDILYRAFRKVKRFVSNILNKKK